MKTKPAYIVIDTDVLISASLLPQSKTAQVLALTVEHFVIALSTNTIAENVVVGAGVEIGTLTVTDPDTSGNNNVLTVSDTTNFRIANGKLIFIGASPNFETAPSYNVTVTSTDGNLVKTQDFTINVTDVAEAPSAIALSASTIAENVVVGAGVEIGTLTVTDPDASGNNNVLTVSDTTNFKIENGKLIFIGASPNFETTPSYNVTVTSADGTFTKTQNFTINVTDANEAPTVTAAAESQTLVEDGGVNNATTGTSTASITLATADPDTGDSASYDQTAMTDTGGWASANNGATYTKTGTYGTATLTAATGVVSYTLDNTKPETQALAQDAPVSDSFTVYVKDTTTGTASTAVTFNITGANDTPAFDSNINRSFYPAPTTETLFAKGATLAQIYDPSQINGTIYGRSNLVSPRLKTFDTSTQGQINLTWEALNGEGWTYQVHAVLTQKSDGLYIRQTGASLYSDGSWDHDQRDMGVNLDFAPAVPENSPADTVVYTARATDPDQDNSLTYSLGTTAGNDNSAFTIDPRTGVIRVKAGTVLDSESGKTNYTLDVVVTDANNASSTQTFNLKVTDVNDNAPVFTSGETGSVAENAAIATAIYTAASTDADSAAANRNVVYTLKAGVGDVALLDISAAGVVTLRASADYESSKKSYSFTVVATNGTLTTEQAVTVNVTDVAEAPTAINLSANNIAENTTIPAGGVKIGDITITDPDATGNSNTLSTTVTGADAASFAIRTVNGVSSLYYTGTSPSYASKSLYNLTVTSTDANNDNALTKPQDLVVNVSQAAINSPTRTGNSKIDSWTTSFSGTTGIPSVYNRDATSADGSANQTDATKRLGQYINKVTGTDVVSDTEFDAGFTLTGKAAAGAQATIKWRLDKDRTTGGDGEGAQVLNIGANDVNSDGSTDVTVAYNNDTGDWSMAFAAGSAALQQAMHNTYGSGVHQLLVDTDGNGARTGTGASIEASRLFLVAAGTAGVNSTDKAGNAVTNTTVDANFSVQDVISKDVFVYYHGDPDGAGVSVRKGGGLSGNVPVMSTDIAPQTWEFHMSTSKATTSFGDINATASDHLATNSNTSRTASLAEVVALYAANFVNSGTTPTPGTVEAIDTSPYTAAHDNRPVGWTANSYWTGAMQTIDGSSGPSVVRFDLFNGQAEVVYNAQHAPWTAIVL